ncbi:uncharacterized protein LOC100374535 [Saccoglossus kowalevskii]|uniref:ATPase inhibitor, mitochondrial-like n=1 Tax=Saccoglossus kowalevskii TaxID=10224 RepID=A0ABM0GT31_SACKO|nr:PREDICTED: ATPase inhibitor, mitochondrial-like [Saccoglossus kowalevskii]
MALLRAGVRAVGLSRNLAVFSQTRVMSTGELGSGVGKGGGGGGSIRESGGSFGKREAAKEEEYFRKLQAQQLKSLRKQHDEEIDFHEAAIRRHKDAISRHKKKMHQIEDEEDEILGDSDSDKDRKK